MWLLNRNAAMDFCIGYVQLLHTIQDVVLKLRLAMNVDLIIVKCIHDFHKTPGFLPQMVPPAIAEQLKSGHQVEPQYFSNATMCYIDVVDFMMVAARFQAVHTVALVGELVR